MKAGLFLNVSHSQSRFSGCVCLFINSKIIVYAKKLQSLGYSTAASSLVPAFLVQGCLSKLRTTSFLERAIKDFQQVSKAKTI